MLGGGNEPLEFLGQCIRFAILRTACMSFIVGVWNFEGAVGKRCTHSLCQSPKTERTN